MTIYIGADHRGYKLKEVIKKWLASLKYNVVDCGNQKYDKDDDFPEFAFLVADKVVLDHESLGIVICGSGGGVTIAANKVRNIRCVTGSTIKDVIHNRQHNNANVLALSSDISTLDMVKEMIKLFIATPYLAEPRMERRLSQIQKRESIATDGRAIGYM